jgi:hypothetical protein
VARLRAGDLRRAEERLRAVVVRFRAGDFRRVVVRFRAGDFRRAVVRFRAVVFRAVVFFRAVDFRAVVFFRAVLLRAVDLRAVFLRAPPLELLRTALVRLFRALLTCVWTSRSALRASPSRFAVAFFTRFSRESREVLSGPRLPPLERRAVLRDGARRLVLLRAVVLRAPPVFLRVVLRAVLRAAGDIKLLSLGDGGDVYFIRRMPTQGATLCKYVQNKLAVEP